MTQSVQDLGRHSMVLCPKSELSSCVKEGPAPSKLISAGTKRRSLVCYQGNKSHQENNKSLKEQIAHLEHGQRLEVTQVQYKL